MGGTAATDRPRTVELFNGSLIRLETSLERQKVDLGTDTECDTGRGVRDPVAVGMTQANENPENGKVVRRLAPIRPSYGGVVCRVPFAGRH